ncbi:Uncharacterised protein [Bordetella pertussis]|nr:Uncharacterised protein [Bordetella pertussis]
MTVTVPARAGAQAAMMAAARTGRNACMGLLLF